MTNSSGPLELSSIGWLLHTMTWWLFWCFCLVLGTTCVQLIKTNIIVISDFPILRCKFWKIFTISSLWNMGIFIIHPRKLRFWTSKMEVWKIIFQWIKGVIFPISMFVFAGCPGWNLWASQPSRQRFRWSRRWHHLHNHRPITWCGSWGKNGAVFGWKMGAFPKGKIRKLFGMLWENNWDQESFLSFWNNSFILRSFQGFFDVGIWSGQSLSLVGSFFESGGGS